MNYQDYLAAMGQLPGNGMAGGYGPQTNGGAWAQQPYSGPMQSTNGGQGGLWAGSDQPLMDDQGNVVRAGGAPVNPTYGYRYGPQTNQPQQGGGQMSAAQAQAAALANPNDRNAMRNWVMAKAAESGQSMDPAGADYYLNKIYDPKNGAVDAGTFDYFGGRIANGGGFAGGGGGMGGGNGFSPLAPFQGEQANFSQFNAPTFSGPSAFNYTGPQATRPTPFSFPGVHQPQAPVQPRGQQPVNNGPAPTPPPKTVAPPPPESAGSDPFGGNGVYIASGPAAGAWLPKDNPQAQQYMATAGQADPAAQAQYEQALQQSQEVALSLPGGKGGGQGAQDFGPVNNGGMMADPREMNRVNGVPQGPGMGRGELDRPQTPESGGFQGYGQPQGAGDFTMPGSGVPAFNAPAPQQAPGAFNAPGLADAQRYDPAQQFSYGQNVPGVQNYQPGQFSYGQGVPQASPFSYGQSSPQYKPGDYQGPQAFGSFDQSGQISAGTPFSADALQTPSTYTPSTFKAPTADEAANDPGYQFRLKQGQDRLEQSAASRGTLFDTGTAKALQNYGQDAASQEYQNVYGRRFNEFQTGENNSAAAAAFNTGTQRATQAQQYGQAANTYGMNQAADMSAQQQSFSNAAGAYGLNQGTQAQNEGQRLNSAQFDSSRALASQAQGYGQARDTAGFNTDTALQTQAQGYGQARDTAGFNEGNQFNAAQFNTNAGLAQQAQGFGQAANTAQMNEQNRMGAAAFNADNARLTQGQQFGQAAQTYGMNADNQFRYGQATQDNARSNYGLNASTQLAGQNQAFGQSMGAWQANNAADANYQQTAWNQQYQPWAQGAQNTLSTQQANQSAQMSTNALNAQAQQAQYNANNQNAWNAYQSQVQQAQFGAGNDLNWAQYGLGAQGQQFNQNLASYNTNQNTIWGNADRDWSQLYGLASLGQNAASNQGNQGQVYANNAGNIITGIGNAQAAGQVGVANAWANAYGNIGNAAMSGYGYYTNRNRQAQG